MINAFFISFTGAGIGMSETGAVIMNKKTRFQFAFNSLTLFVLFSLGIGTVHAVDFNTDILDTEDKENIDISRFSQEGYVMPGQYQLAVLLNGEDIIPETSIPFYVRELTPNTSPTSQACITPELAEKMGLTEKSLARITRWHDDQCIDFSALKGTRILPDTAQSQLNISMPKMYLEYSDSTWLPPSRWDNGIAGILFDYNANFTINKPKDGSKTQNGWINGTLGGNYGAWRLRADYQGSYTHESGRNGRKDSTFDWSRVYLFRALPMMQSVLNMGEMVFNSDLFSHWNYTGIGLSSDERQLPPKFRGYAPQINGIATSNARVTVSQQGRVIYDTTVPAGPFTLQDIGSAVRGTLDVKVTEQNGQVKTFQVNASYVPYLTRPGQIRYKVASGRSRDGFHRTEGPIFSSGEISYGLSNRWSLYGGGVFAGNYNAVALGAGIDLMPLGALSADITQAVARFPQHDNQQGKSWRLSYSKRFDDIDTDVTFAGYRFSDRQYMTMQQYLDARYRNVWDNGSKEMYTISINKNFPDQQLSLGASFNHQTYWDRGETTDYSVRADKYFSAFGLNNLSLGLTASRSRYAETGKMNDEIALRLSVPWNSDTINYNGSYNDSRLSQTIGYNGRVGTQDNYSVMAGVNTGGGESARGQFNGYYSHVGDLAQTSASVSAVQNQYVSMGLSAYGGATLTAEGAALHAGGFNGNTRLMVDTDGVADVPIDGGRLSTNHWGIGVVTDLNSYYRNTTSVDVNKLADDVEARESVVESVLTDGAIGFRKFSVLKGQRLFAVLSLTDGSKPPFGASVRNAKGRELGIVDEGGLAWISGAQPNETLTVAWQAKQCQATLPNTLNSMAQQLLLPCQSIATTQEKSALVMINNNESNKSDENK